MGTDSKEYELARLKQELEWQEKRKRERKKFQMEMLKWLGLFAVSFAIGFYFKFDIFG